jgi:hypothetical protein
LDMRQSLNIGWWRYAHHQQHSLVLGCINARRRTKVRGKSSIKRQAAGCEPPLNCRGETDHSRTFAPQCSGARQGQSNFISDRSVPYYSQFMYLASCFR